MPIVSSAIVEDAPQADGRRWITEAHTDQAGIVHALKYMAAAGANVASVMAARVASLNTSLVADEIWANIQTVIGLGSLATISLVHSTAGANAAALRAIYPSLAQVQAIMAGDYLSSLSNGVLQAAFGITAGQVTTLRTNTLTPAAVSAAAIRAAQGV